MVRIKAIKYFFLLVHFSFIVFSVIIAFPTNPVLLNCFSTYSSLCITNFTKLHLLKCVRLFLILFDNRYNFKTDDPLLLAQQLSALTSFGQGGTNGGYFRRDTQLLGAVLEKIFNSLTFIPQEEIEAIQQKNGSVSKIQTAKESECIAYMEKHCS